MYAETATGGHGDTSVTGVSCVSSVRGDASTGKTTTKAFSAERVLASAHHKFLFFHNKFSGVLAIIVFSCNKNCFHQS